MAIATIVSTSTEVQLVFSHDPDVTPKNGAIGWLPKDGAKVNGGADVVTVRPLNVDERAETADVGLSLTGGTRLHAQQLARARAGLVAVNGQRKAEDLAQWLNACPTDVIFALGLYVHAITNATDPALSQAQLFGGEPDGDSKSVD